MYLPPPLHDAADKLETRSEKRLGHSLGAPAGAEFGPESVR